MKTSVPNRIARFVLLALTLVCAFASKGKAQNAPELVFKNPVLKSGQANKEGSVYRFSNIAIQNGQSVDAEVKLKKFSRNDIVMRTVDNGTLGWDKAFQPEFGLPGLVQPNQDWYIDFELSFYKSGTNQKQTMQVVDMTALDIDGDGNSITEYAQFENPDSISYSTVSYLTSSGGGAQSMLCGQCNVSSVLKTCNRCNGDGTIGNNDCTDCNGSGLLHSTCNHAFQGTMGALINGPVVNFTNIDTSATQVMATYKYLNKSKLRFRYGARSGNLSSNGSGIRLNSVWFRKFSLAPVGSALPAHLTTFSASLQNNEVMLTWKAREEGFSHYIVQRSEDGKVYRDAAMIFSRNSGAGYGDYKYNDKNLTSAGNTIYYRLVMVDQTGEATYSPVKVVRLNKVQSLELSVFPNPVSSQLQIAIPANWQNKPVVIEVVSMNGMAVKTVQSGAAQSTETIAVDALSKGSYVVRVRTQTETAQQKFIKN